MTTAFDVPPEPLLKRLADQFKTEEKAKPPAWAAFAKTGVHTEKAPTNPDWWYLRMASILRKVYRQGPVGAQRLAALYGGFRDRGVRPNHARAGSRSIAREAMQRLEALGLLQTIKGRGRVVSAKGRASVDAAAHAVAQELEKTIPGLAKY